MRRRDVYADVAEIEDRIGDQQESEQSRKQVEIDAVNGAPFALKAPYARLGC